METRKMMRVTYWGTTGSIPTPLSPQEAKAKVVECLRLVLAQPKPSPLESANNIQSLVERRTPFFTHSTFGGNTTCVEVETADVLAILDAGTGARVLGLDMEKRQAADNGKGIVGHIFLSHMHFDHLTGLPFCQPLYNPANHFTVWGHPDLLDIFQQFLKQKAKWARAIFPPVLEKLQGIKEIKPISPGDKIKLGKTTVRAISLNHLGGSQGYRFDAQGKSFVFATDHEMINGPDKKLARFAQDADLLYLDAQYSLSEYEGSISSQRPGKKGWGHSPMEWALETALMARAKELHLGHREPDRLDTDLAQIEKRLAGMGGTKVRVAIPWEGMEVKI
ncbi:MAG: MBL fold metallo-hydrolase [Gemmataceae bacterium]|nr:MBL fold metallo-hydrolase [Gemmataceae bacterium]